MKIRIDGNLVTLTVSIKLKIQQDNFVYSHPDPFLLQLQFQSENGIFNFIDWDPRGKLKNTRKEKSKDFAFEGSSFIFHVEIFHEFNGERIKGWGSNNFISTAEYLPFN
jgi:hypothetical protein